MTDETIKKYTRRIADANKTQIIVLVYEIAEIHLEDAIEFHRDGKTYEFMKSCERAARCINDLIESLDLQYDISENLMDIYMFINRELSLASIRLDVATVKRLLELVTKLKLAFTELADQDDSEPLMGNSQGVYAGYTYGPGSSLTETTDIDGNRGFKA